MSAFKFFRLQDGRAEKLTARTASLERDIQQLFERNLEPLLDVRLLESEYSFPGGRIDTLGLDTDNRPVVIEYKRSEDSRIIPQIMEYVANLEEDRRGFEQLVKTRLGDEAYHKINWHADIRVICVAANFSKGDYAMEKKTSGLELVRYQLLGEGENLALEWSGGKVPSESAYYRMRQKEYAPHSQSAERPNLRNKEKHAAGKELQELYNDLDTYIFGLGQGRFASIAMRPKLSKYGGGPAPNHVRVYLKIDPRSVQKEVNEGFVQLMRKGPRIRIYNRADLERAKPLLRRAYEEGKR